MKKGRVCAASAAANKGIDYFWQIASTMRGEKTCELFRKLANGYCGQGASERLNKLVKKTRNKLRNRQQHETTQAYLRLDSHYKRLRHFQDEVPKHYLESVKQQINRMAKLVEEDAAEKAEAAAEEVGDDVILQQIDAEEAAEIEDERATVPEEAILEPYSEVEDVAGNVLIDLLLKDTGI